MQTKIIPAIKVGTIWVDKVRQSKVTIKGVSDPFVVYETEDNARYNQIKDVFLAEYEPVRLLGSTGGSPIHSPQHYQVFPYKEAIEIIASSMTTEQFYGYCLGNFLKYRLRIGAKDEVQQELGKSNKYKELYEKHKHLCK